MLPCFYRRRETEADREGHSHDRRIGRQEHRVAEARRDLLQNVAAIGERIAEVALQRPEEPHEIAHDRRPIEAEIEAELGQAFGRRLILQDCGGEVARAILGPDEDED